MRKLTLLFLLLNVAHASAAEKDNPPDIRTLMTPEDYAASGLDQLTDAQRKQLSEWVERYREGAVVGPVVQKPPSKMTEEEKVEAKKIREVMDADIVAKVIPAFRGWSGKTIFRLDNGQVWQQRMAGKLRYNGPDNTVTIRRNQLGKYVLNHDDTGRGVGVVRIE